MGRFHISLRLPGPEFAEREHWTPKVPFFSLLLSIQTMSEGAPWVRADTKQHTFEHIKDPGYINTW